METKRRNIYHRITQYISDLDTFGKIIAGLGFLPAIVDVINLIMGDDVLIPTIWVFIIFVCAILIANFRLYETLKRSKIEITLKSADIIFAHPIQNNLPKHDVFLNENFKCIINGIVDIEINDPLLNDAHFIVHSISTNWPINSELLSQNEISLEISNNEVENPLIIKDRNSLPNCKFKVELPIKQDLLEPPSKLNERDLGMVFGTLEYFEVIIGVKIKYGNVVHLSPISLNVSHFLNQIENAFIQLFIVQAREANYVPNAIFALKSFWIAKSNQDK